MRLKRLFCVVFSFLLMSLIVLPHGTDASATSLKTIKRAYAQALSDGTIKYKDTATYYDGSNSNIKLKLQYALYDFNRDGVKDLLLLLGDEYDYDLYGWTYKSGKVRVLFKKQWVRDNIYCDHKNKRYIAPGEEADCWIDIFKLKQKKLVATVRYEWNLGDKYATKKIGNQKAKKISKASFDKKWASATKKPHPNFKSTTKSALIRKWN